MFNLSKESEADLVTRVAGLVGDFLGNYTRPEPRVLGLMTAKQIREELGIGRTTLHYWEKLGLRRYIPPVDSTKLAFYKVEDVLVFLGVK